MYKVKILITYETEFGYCQRIDECGIALWGITDWDEINDEDSFNKLKNAVLNANSLNKSKSKRHRYILVFYYDDSGLMFDEVYKNSNEFIKKIEKEQVAEQKKKEEAKKRREANAEQKKRKQLEKLKKELGED